MVAGAWKPAWSPLRGWARWRLAPTEERVVTFQDERADPWALQIRDVSDSLARLLLELRPADERWVAETRALVDACRALAGGSASAPLVGHGGRELDRYFASLDIVDAGLRHRRADVLDRAYVMLEDAVARLAGAAGD